MITNKDIWPIVKLRLNLDDDQEGLVETYIDEIGHRILHYCNLTEIPAGLKSTWASMVIDALRIEQPNLEGIEDTSGGGESVKIGDTSVSPASGSVLTNASKSVIDQVVLNYRVDLHRFRRLRW